MKRLNPVLFAISLAVITLSASFCSRTRGIVEYDFYDEFLTAQKTVPQKDYDLFENWDLHLRWNGWRKDQNVEKGVILIPQTHSNAFLKFSIITQQEQTLKLVLKPLIGPMEVDFYINGRKVHEEALGTDYQTVELLAESEYLLIGENILEIVIPHEARRMSKSYWLALKDFQILESTPSENKSLLPPEELFQSQIEKGILSKNKTIKQRVNTSLNYSVILPEKTRLHFGYSLNDPDRDSTEKREFSIYIQTSSGQKDMLFSHEFDGEKPNKKRSAVIDLIPYQNEIARISFCFLNRNPQENTRAELVLWNPRLVTDAVKEDKSQSQVVREEIRKPFNIMIYLVDCLRPDHLPFYGYEKNTAPFMKEFAEDSIIFRNSHSQSSWTRPSVGALFTGLHPFQHRAITLKSGLSPKFETMAEFLQKAGFFTAGISSNAGIKEYFDFHQGFEYFQYHGKQGGGIAEKLNEYILPLLDRIKTPFFMYIHTMDAHRPYFLNEEFIPPPPDDPIYADSRRIHISKAKKGREYDVVLDYSIAQYDAAIRQNDKSFGDLISELKKQNLYDSTMIILMSDHGEEFYDHGKFAHGSSLYQEVIHNVLVVKMPDQIMAGKVIEENVQQIDLLPTILELTEQPVPLYMAGHSLRDLLVSAYVPASPLHETMFFEACADLRKKALIMGRWKIIHTGRQWRDNPFEWEVYDLQEDPQEKNDLANINVIASEYLKKRLTSWAQAQEKLKTLGVEDVEKTLTDEDIEEFRALGYIK